MQTVNPPASDLLLTPLNSKLLSTGLLILAVITLHLVLRQLVARANADDLGERRRWIVQLRNGLLLILFVGLVIIWGTQLRTFALSVVAIAAALVLATKELIMCLSGGLVRGTSRAFQIGDRIEVNGLRGDVSDQRLLSTTILEVGPGQSTHQYTGQTITLPNSVFLSSPVRNETLTDEYVLHTFPVVVDPSADWKTIERTLLAVAEEVCGPYLHDARRSLEKLGEAQGLRALSAEPRVTITLPEPNKLQLLVRVPAPARRRGRIEEQIVRGLLDRVSLKAAETKDQP